MAPPGNTPGSLGLHITQVARNQGSITVYNATGHQPQACTTRSNCESSTPRPCPNSLAARGCKPHRTTPRCPTTATCRMRARCRRGRISIEKNTGASDNYPLSLFNAGQDVITAQPVGVPSTVCSIGDYDGGVRELTVNSRSALEAARAWRWL